jgi:ATP-dependent DNA helicase RecG
MKSTTEIVALLDRLDKCIADDLESQDLDFKQWNQRSLDDNIKLMLEMAVCMANGGGGSVVFGVADKVKGRANAIKGVPLSIDTLILQKRVYERTEPRLTPVFEDIKVPEGTGRLLVMHVFPGMPPYTLTDGSATIRQGKDCIPLTGSLRRKMIDASGQVDFTAEQVFEDWKSLVSPSAMERIRDIMAAERADEALNALNDEDLLRSIGALKNNYLTKGALLLVGKPDAIARNIPQHRWSFRKMISDTDYSHRDDGTHPISVALYELERYIEVDNPRVTVESGLIHPEFSTYPKIALREALLNAFGHRDYRLMGTVMLKQYKDKLIISNPGDFIDGITPENILHHPPAARNGHLMDLLDKLRLVNRSNLGVPRIFRSLLLEGKEPPVYRSVGNAVELTFIASPLKTGFNNLVRQLTSQGKYLDVDHLLLLHYLMRHSEIDTSTAVTVCQRAVPQAREILSYMENELGLVEARGRGKGRYYALTRFAYKFLEGEMHYERKQSLDMEAIKLRILTILKDRPLTNSEVRQITRLDRKQVNALIHELKSEGVKIEGYGRGAKYVYAPDK